MNAVVGFIDVDAVEAMAYQLAVNAILTARSLPVLKGRYQFSQARDALMAGEPAESFAERFAVLARARCATCAHERRDHGDITHSCLKMVRGRFDGASDQTRCRCKRFTASVRT